MLAAPITFKVIPGEAYFVADGAALAPTVRTLDRPARGVTRVLIVRAEGYEDQRLTIDDAVPASVDVWLNALPKKGATSGKTASSPSSPVSDTSSVPPPEALPANPY